MTVGRSHRGGLRNVDIERALMTKRFREDLYCRSEYFHDAPATVAGTTGRNRSRSLRNISSANFPCVRIGQSRPLLSLCSRLRASNSLPAGEDILAKLANFCKAVADYPRRRNDHPSRVGTARMRFSIPGPCCCADAAPLERHGGFEMHGAGISVQGGTRHRAIITALDRTEKQSKRSGAISAEHQNQGHLLTDSAAMASSRRMTDSSTHEENNRWKERSSFLTVKEHFAMHIPIATSAKREGDEGLAITTYPVHWKHCVSSIACYC